MDLLKYASQTIPAPDMEIKTMHQDGDTADIIETILYADSQLNGEMCEFSKYFAGIPPSFRLKELWKFTRQAISYKADSPGHERVKDPRVTWADRYGDCKSFSLFIAAVLKCMGIPYKYRFAAYQKGDPTHVYILAKFSNRWYILDATIDQFNFEVPYFQKWDKMPKIDYLHGAKTKAPSIHTASKQPTKAQRIANAPRGKKPPVYIDYSGMTEGQLTLTLLDEQAQILARYYGDDSGTYQAARNIIYNASKDLHRGPAIYGAIAPEHYGLMAYVQHARERSKPAGIATPLHIGDFASDRKAILDLCRHANNELRKYNESTFTDPFKSGPNKPKYQPAKQDGTAWDLKDLGETVRRCSDQVFFMDLFNQHLEKSSAHVLYEFIPETELNQLPATANFKANSHQLANSSMARYSQLDRVNIALWLRNGIMRSAAEKNLADISPEGIIGQWKQASDTKIGIDPVSLTAIASIIVAAIGGASALLKLILTKKATFASEVRGYGSPEFGPEKGDFKQGPPVKKGFDFTSLIPFAALAAGGLLLLNDKK